MGAALSIEQKATRVSEIKAGQQSANPSVSSSNEKIVENNKQFKDAITATPVVLLHTDNDGCFWGVTVFQPKSLFTPLREYLLFLPHQHVHSDAAGSISMRHHELPVMIHFHGKCETAWGVGVSERRWVLTACKHQFAVIYGQARGSMLSDRQLSGHCIWDLDFPDDGDDMEYMCSICDDLLKGKWSGSMLLNLAPNFCCSPNNIFYSGFSNGALFASNIALRFSTIFAGICNTCGGLSLADGVLLPPNNTFDVSKTGSEVKTDEVTQSTRNFQLQLQTAKDDSHRKVRFENFGSMIPCEFVAQDFLRWPMTWPPIPERVPMLIITGTNDTMLLQCRFAAYLLSSAGFPLWMFVRPDGQHEWLINEEDNVWEFMVMARQLDPLNYTRHLPFPEATFYHAGNVALVDA